MEKDEYEDGYDYGYEYELYLYVVNSHAVESVSMTPLIYCTYCWVTWL